MQMNNEVEQECLFDRDFFCGKMSPVLSQAERRKAKTSASSWRRSVELKATPYQFLDLTPGAGDLLGQSYWDTISPWHGGVLMHNTGVSPREEKGSSLSLILQAQVPAKYYLTPKACLGILRRAYERGKALPPQLEQALMIQAGLTQTITAKGCELPLAFHINQREETIDLGETAVALMATTNMQMQTFVTEKPVAFAANQRDEVRDLHDVATALGSQPGMKQQTFVAGVVSKGNGDCFLMPEQHTSISGGGGQAGQGYPCILAAAFSAGQGAKAGGIGYQEECAPTLKASESGSNMVPSVLCLNDQGGSVMECTEEISGTLRAQEHGHQPLVFENHGIDSRYTGPHQVAPTMSARYGTGGNNVPLVTQEEMPVICIAGNAIDRQPQNGGNGFGYQEDIAYTLTATDHHAVFSRQRVDVFENSNVASTQSARQHKDATDLVYQETVGALTSIDRKGPNSQYVSQDKCVVEGARLIRRLTPVECERLQGFPDTWTDIPGASDSARYKALGNSVAIPCVDFILAGIARVLRS